VVLFVLEVTFGLLPFTAKHRIASHPEGCRALTQNLANKDIFDIILPHPVAEFLCPTSPATSCLANILSARRLASLKNNTHPAGRPETIDAERSSEEQEGPKESNRKTF